MGINAGFFALSINFVVTTVVSLFTAAEPNAFDDAAEEVTNP